MDAQERVARLEDAGTPIYRSPAERETLLRGCLCDPMWHPHMDCPVHNPWKKA